jgi:hypothetical protein
MARLVDPFLLGWHTLHMLFDTIVFLSGPNNLYPEDLIPFTRYPLFLIIDSENSHAFKAGLSELNLGL